MNVIYLGRSVPRQWFRAFVYNACGDKKLANSYDEYMQFKAFGWFDSVEDAKQAVTAPEPVTNTDIKDDAPVSEKRRGRAKR